MMIASLAVHGMSSRSSMCAPSLLLCLEFEESLSFSLTHTSFHLKQFPLSFPLPFEPDDKSGQTSVPVSLMLRLLLRQSEKGVHGSGGAGD